MIFIQTTDLENPTPTVQPRIENRIEKILKLAKGVKIKGKLVKNVEMAMGP